MISQVRGTLQRLRLRGRIWLRRWLRWSRRSGRLRCFSATSTTSAATLLIATLTTTGLRSDLFATTTTASAALAATTTWLIAILATATSTASAQFFTIDDAVSVAVETPESATNRLRHPFQLFLVDHSIAVAIETIESATTTLRWAIAIAGRALTGRGASFGRWTTTSTKTFQFFRSDHAISIGVGRAEPTAHPFRHSFQFFLVDHSIAVAIETLDQASSTTPFRTRIVTATIRSRTASAPSEDSVEFFTGDRAIPVGVGTTESAAHTLGNTFQLFLVENSIAVAIEPTDQTCATTTSATTFALSWRGRSRIISRIHHRWSRWSGMILTRRRARGRCRVGLGILSPDQDWHHQDQQQCREFAEKTHECLLKRNQRYWPQRIPRH